MSVKINNIEKQMNGLLIGKDLYKQGDIKEVDRLFLNVKGDVDIPISSSDYIILKGDENFTSGQTDIEDNPLLKKKIIITLNGIKIELDRAKIECKNIRLKDVTIDGNSWLYADLDNLPDQKIEDQFRLIVRTNDRFITIPATEDDGLIDIERCANFDRKPPKKQNKYRIKIDGEKYIVEQSHLSGGDILALVGKNDQKFALQQKFKGGKREVIEPNQDVDFSKKGVERFETVPKQAQQGNSEF